MSSKILYQTSVSLGCDPEVFIVGKDGKIIPSFEVIPEGGLPTSDGKIARDGIQVEFQPLSGGCRQTQGTFMSTMISTLTKRLPEGAKIDLALQNVVIPKSVLMKMPVEARRLGCAPSENVYGTRPMKINPETYRRRSAGGHLHFGLSFSVSNRNATRRTIRPAGIEVVKALDVILGNTCVLIDRDPGNAIRRRIYGRAGEYRLPAQTRVEYRTLSNFWIRCYFLQSMVYAIGRQAVSVPAQMHDSWISTKWDAYSALMQNIDLKKVVKAINTNDYDLAFETWQVVREFLLTHTQPTSSGLSSNTMPGFDKFLEAVKKDGLDATLNRRKQDWTKFHTNVGLEYSGFEAYLKQFAQ